MLALEYDQRHISRMNRLATLPQEVIRTASRLLRRLRSRVVVEPWSWRRVRAAALLLAVLAVTGASLFVVQAGGVDPATARLLRHDVVLWPGGGFLRHLAVTVARYRPAHPATLEPLLRMVHTLPAGEPLWSRSLTATGALLDVAVDDAQATASLARLDAAAAARSGRPLDARAGVLGWWPIDEYFVMWLDEVTGADAVAAADRFNRLQPPDGLPTAEWILSELGLALLDERPLPFVVVADGPAGGWHPVAMVADQVPVGARRLDVRTVGEAIAVTLWALEEDPGEPLTFQVTAAWNRIAAARRLPRLPER